MAATGLELAGGGVALLVFALAGLAYVHYVLPRFNRSIGFPEWHEGKWVKRWNYGWPLALAALAGLVVVIGVVGWAAGWTFG